MARQLYMNYPEEIKDESGLIRALTDINGNRFNAYNMQTGSELMIDYPHESGRGFKVVVYEVVVNTIKHWREIKRKELVPRKNLPFSEWKDGWSE